MPEIIVDLNTRIIPPNLEVYVARPGQDYRLYGDFIEQDSIAPELPLLDLPLGQPPSQIPDLLRRIRRSRAIRSWYRTGHKEDEAPSLDLDIYSNESGDKRVQALRTVLLGFLERVKPGDVVIVPPKAYSNSAYIGIVQDQPHFHELRTRRYYDHPLTARKVQWITSVQKRTLPIDILEALEHPTSIYLLARSLRPKIFEMAFGSFLDLSVTGGDFTSRFEVTEARFDTVADFTLQAFFNAVAANVKAIDSGATQLLPPKHAAFTDVSQYTPELRSNINSPGTLTLVSKKLTPIIAAAMLALAIECGPAAVDAASNGKITIGNSKAPPGDQCTASVATSVLAQIELLGLLGWPEACELAAKAASATGIKSTVTITQTP